MSASRRGFAALGASLVLLWGCAGTPPLGALPETSKVAARVVLLSVSGLTAPRLATAMPTLAAMAEAGAAAERVAGVAPAAVLPAHATLVTGAPPPVHGIVADRRLGDRGVRASGYDHASLLRTHTLWQRAMEAKIPVAALDWPSTLGSAIPVLVPDLGSKGASRTWTERLVGEVPRPLLERVGHHGGDRPGSGASGALHDAVIARVACDLLASNAPPGLLLLRLHQTAPVLAEHGPGSHEAEAAFAAVDHEIQSLLVCLERAGRLTDTAWVVTGDRGVAEVHTEIAANVELVQEGLIARSGDEIVRWEGIVRSNGGSAFVYARSEDAAVRARIALAEAAARSGAFRVVGADEMIRSEADPEAWFGLEAEAGFAFRDGVGGPLLTPASRRGAGGYLPSRSEMDTTLVAWGAGIRRGLRIPQMRQTDVAPTLARLLGLRLEGTSGRALVGVLTSETQQPVGAEPR